MKKIFVRIKSTGKIYSYEPKDKEGNALKVKPNQTVIIEMDQIIEEGKILKDLNSESEVEEGQDEILRVINYEDHEWCCGLKNMAREYITEAQKKVDIYGLEMKILDADLSFDQKKITFYFSAKGRVDFRGLVQDVARSFGKLIRLQQVGTRDQARLLGGIGKCGRELCCSKFLNNIESVTLEMAEAQELTGAAVSKLSGCCGKLMCCLSFETENYPSCAKAPKIDKETK